MFTFNFEEEYRQGKESGDRIALEISEENEAHMAENRILKEQNQIDENIRNEFEKKVLDHNLTNDKIVETEKWNKQMEYRQFLLKQIEDKEKEKKARNSPEIRGNFYVYSEELMAPEMRKNLKLTKQQEMKSALDECIRMKNALKQENKQKEIEEERVRMDFLRKRETDEIMAREQAKQQIEDKELKKEEAARQWKSTNKDSEREQFIDSLMRKDTTLSHLENKDLVDVEEIRVEKDLLEQQQEEIAKIEEDSIQNETAEIDRQDIVDDLVVTD